MPTDAKPLEFTTSQPRELLACVEFAAEQAERIADDPGAWRWIIISMVLGVQNACLCALDYDDEFGTKGMTRRDARAVTRWTRAGRSGPAPLAVQEPRIVSPLELVNRVADDRFLRAPFQLPATREMREAFDALVELRNSFLHFSEDGWTIDLRELPPLVMGAASIIRHLAVTQPVYLRNAEKGHSRRTAEALDRIEAVMDHAAG